MADAESELDRARREFRESHGFDPKPVVDQVLRDGEYELAGGTEDEREFIRWALSGGCEFCLGKRCPCTCTADCGARPGAGFRNFCPHGDGYEDYLRSTGLHPDKKDHGKDGAR